MTWYNYDHAGRSADEKVFVTMSVIPIEYTVVWYPIVSSYLKLVEPSDRLLPPLLHLILATVLFLDILATSSHVAVSRPRH
jgi:hypothetical protein